jgi:hypothetical protein
VRLASRYRAEPLGRARNMTESSLTRLTAAPSHVEPGLARLVSSPTGDRPFDMACQTYGHHPSFEGCDKVSLLDEASDSLNMQTPLAVSNIQGLLGSGVFS